MAVSTHSAKRRWLPRFGLKTLLILVTLLGVGFGYLGNLYRRVNHQRSVVAKIERAGGSVRYNWQWDMGPHSDPMTNIDLATTSSSSKELPSGLMQITRVSPDGTSVQTEKLPGPAILRLLLGNDTFALVEFVNFNDWSKPPGPFDPQLLLELPQPKNGSALRLASKRYIARLRSADSRASNS